MTREEMSTAYKMIRELLGECANSPEARREYRNMSDKLIKIAEKYGVEALNMTLVQSGSGATGITKSGKTVKWYANCGMENRSRYCGTLYIDGKAVFTSGTIAKALEYMAQN